MSEVQTTQKNLRQLVTGVENRLQTVETQSGLLIEIQKGQNFQGLANTLTQRIQMVERSVDDQSQRKIVISEQFARLEHIDDHVSEWEKKWAEFIAIKLQQIQFQERLSKVERVERKVSMLHTQQTTSTDMLNDWSIKLIDVSDSQVRQKADLAAMDQHIQQKLGQFEIRMNDRLNNKQYEVVQTVQNALGQDRGLGERLD